MKKRYELVRYAAYNVTGMKLHLEKMARNGWLIEHISNNFWCYKKVEPIDLTFTVSYFAKASAFDPEKSAGQETFEEMAAHDGWKLMAENAKLQIYANDDKDATPIYTDAESEVNAIIKSSKNFILSMLLLTGMVIINLFTFYSNIKHHVVEALADYSIIFVLFGIFILFANMLNIVIRYFIWKHKALKAIENDEFLSTAKSDFSFQTQITFIAIGIMICGFIASGNTKMAIVMLTSFLIFMSGYFIIDAFRNLLRKKKVDKDTNLFFTILVDIGIAIILAIFVVSLQSKAMFSDITNKDKILLHPSDFNQVTDYEMKNDYKESVFLRLNKANTLDAEDDSFSYAVVDVKLKSLEDFVFESLLEEYDDYDIRYDEDGNPVDGKYYEYHEVDATIFEADKAYNLHEASKEGGTYLIKYDKRIVKFWTAWKLDDQDLQIIINTFKS